MPHFSLFTTIFTLLLGIVFSVQASPLTRYTTELIVRDSLPDCGHADKYDTIDDILDQGNVPEACVNMYILSVLAKTMRTALDDYKDIMTGGYEDKYKAYAEQVRAAAPDKWDKFYGEKMDEFFTCKYSIPNDDGTKYHNITDGCPPGKEPDKYKEHPYNVYFIVKDEKDFCDEISKHYGLDCSWLEPHRLELVPCLSDDFTCDNIGSQYLPHVNPDFKVPDPSALITKSLEKYKDIADWIEESALASQVYLFTGRDADAVDAASTAVFTTKSAVAAMKNVAKTGEKIEKQERDAIIIAFVSAFLLVLPGLGEALEAVVDVALIARTAALISEVGNTALTIYDVAKDPSSAPMAIMGGLIGGVAGREAATWSKVASIRRAMPNDVLKKMGDDVVTHMDKVAKVCKTCRP